MKVTILATNIRGGGGVTYLVELLKAAHPEQAGISSVIVYCNDHVKAQLPSHNWLTVKSDSLLNKSLPFRLWWMFKNHKKMINSDTDVLFAMGGNYQGKFQPYVSICQNFLPFDKVQRKKSGLSWVGFRLWLLGKLQSKTFAKAQGMIYLTQYTAEKIQKTLGVKPPMSTIIPHGLNNQFKFKPKPQIAFDKYTFEKPFQLLNVSIIDFYKYQWELVTLVAALRKNGLPIELHLIGGAYKPSLNKLQKAIAEVDPNHEFIKYHGLINYDELQNHYQAADAFIFSSTCEAFGLILLEAMAAGLPIFCHELPVAKEVADDSVCYFDIFKQSKAVEIIQSTLLSQELRTQLSEKAYQRAQEFSWEQCAHDTFDFLAKVAKDYKDNKCVE